MSTDYQCPNAHKDWIQMAVSEVLNGYRCNCVVNEHSPCNIISSNVIRLSAPNAQKDLIQIEVSKAFKCSRYNSVLHEHFPCNIEKCDAFTQTDKIHFCRLVPFFHNCYHEREERRISHNFFSFHCHQVVL